MRPNSRMLKKIITETKSLEIQTEDSRFLQLVSVLFQIPHAKLSSPVSTKSSLGRSCLVRTSQVHKHKTVCACLTGSVSLCVWVRPVSAILWWGGLLPDPPVSQQQRPVLVCGSLWQRGGRITHTRPCRLRYAKAKKLCRARCLVSVFVDGGKKAVFDLDNRWVKSDFLMWKQTKL